MDKEKLEKLAERSALKALSKRRNTDSELIEDDDAYEGDMDSVDIEEVVSLTFSITVKKILLRKVTILIIQSKRMVLWPELKNTLIHGKSFKENMEKVVIRLLRSLKLLAVLLKSNQWKLMEFQKNEKQLKDKSTS